MKIFSIANYKIPAGLKRLNKNIQLLDTKVGKLMKEKTSVTGLLPNSMKKCNGTNMTVAQLIELVLKNS